jgi:hypothetical protein
MLLVNVIWFVFSCVVYLCYGEGIENALYVGLATGAYSVILYFFIGRKIDNGCGT